MPKLSEYGVTDIIQNRMVLGQCVARNARKYPDKIAIVYGEKRISYQKFNARCNALAWALREKGVEQGDKVAVYLQNCNELLEIWIALNKLGAIFCGINFFWSRKEELLTVIKNSDCVGIIFDNDFEGRISPILPDLPELRFSISVGIKKSGQWISYDELVEKYPKIELPRECCPRETDPAAMMYTAGTTAPLPKGVVHTHLSILSNIMNLASVYGLTSIDVLAFVTPLFHCSSGVVALLGLWLGGKIVIMRPSAPDILRTMEIKLIEKEKITFFWQVSTLWQMLLSMPQEERKKYDVSSLKIMIGGGAYTPVHIRKELMTWFDNATFSEMYGLTENFGPCLYVPLGLSLEKPDSIGILEPNVEAKIVSDGKQVSIGETGELLIRGPIVTQGYYRNPEANREAFTEDGWFHTGDILKEDKDGFFYFLDRKKDIIVSGGENISSIEVESVIKAHPNVLDAAIIPVPDEKWGDRVHACIVVKKDMHLTEEEIIGFCKQKLSGFKVPKSVTFEESLPYSPNMKVLKRNLREKYRK